MIRNELIPDLDQAFPIVRVAGVKVCGFCKGPLPSQRFRWCSQACRDEAWSRTNPGHMRILVHRRDKGICANCGWDTDKFLRVARQVRADSADPGIKAWNWLFVVAGIAGRECCSIWEADHIIPLIEGGENILANMRTLCILCHKTETRKLARRRALARRKTLFLFDLAPV